MRVEEAAWVGEHLSQLDVKTVLELGSSTSKFRTKSQPHIDRLIHSRLRAKNVRIVHADLKPGTGVDIVGDLYTRAIQDTLKSVHADALLCCNLLEHVTSPADLATICHSIIRPGAYLIVTAPFSYPVHNDPVDTYFRPSPKEIAELFPGYRTVTSTIITSTSFGQDLLNDPAFLMKAIPLRAYWLLKLWLPRHEYAHLNHRLLWLFRPYRISCVLLRRPL